MDLDNSNKYLSQSLEEAFFFQKECEISEKTVVRTLWVYQH